MFRSREALIIYLLIVAAIAGALLWRESANLPELGRVITTGEARVGGPFHLINQNGAARSDADFRGRYMLVYFGYSNCPDVCPTTLGVIADALGKMGAGAARVVPVFITVDPSRDTPKALGLYMKAFGPAFVGLTGSPASIAMTEKEYHVYAKKQPLPGGNYGMDHSSVIYLMGPDGKLVTFYDEAISPEDLAKDLAARMDG